MGVVLDIWQGSEGVEYAFNKLDFTCLLSALLSCLKESLDEGSHTSRWISKIEYNKQAAHITF